MFMKSKQYATIIELPKMCTVVTKFFNNQYFK